MAARGALRTRIVLLFATAALPLLALAGWLSWQGLQQREESIARDRELLAVSSALAAQAFVDGNLALLGALTRHPTLTEARSDAEVAAFLERELAANPGWETLSVLDADGWNLVVAGASAPPRTISLADRPQVRRAAETGRPSVGPAAISRLRGTAVVGTAAPIVMATGERRTLLAPLSLDVLRENLRSRLASPSITVSLVDEQGRVFLQTAPSVARDLPSLRPRADVEAALVGRVGSQRVAAPDGAALLSAHAPVEGTGWGLLVLEPVEIAFGPARTRAVTSLALLVGALAATGLLVWSLGGRLALSYQRAALLSSASQAFAEARLDLGEVLARLTRRVADHVGDGCVVFLVDPESEYLEPIALHHHDRTALELARLILASSPVRIGEGLSGRVAATGQPLMRPVLGRDDLRGTAKPEFLPYLERFRVHSLIVVPMHAHGRLLGVLSLWRDETARSYRPDDQRLVQELADRAALAIHNAYLYRQAQDAVRARDEFLSIAAHELKTPIAALKAAAQLMLRARQRGGLADDRLEQGLAVVDGGANRLTGLVNDLLDVARLRSGRLPHEPHPVDLSALVADVLARQRDLLGPAHRLVLDAPDPTGLVEVDPGRFEQVLTNLLDNAVKYSPDGGEVRVGLVPDAEGVTITVRDRGIGLPAEAIEAIFQPFGRADNAVRLPGMGLGLYICRGIVERHGGRIWVSSDGPGLGTTVAFWLPRSTEVAGVTGRAGAAA